MKTALLVFEMQRKEFEISYHVPLLNAFVLGSVVFPCEGVCDKDNHRSNIHSLSDVQYFKQQRYIRIWLFQISLYVSFVYLDLFINRVEISGGSFT